MAFLKSPLLWVFLSDVISFHNVIINHERTAQTGMPSNFW